MTADDSFIGCWHNVEKIIDITTDKPNGIFLNDCSAVEQASAQSLEWPLLAKKLSAECLTILAKGYWKNPISFTNPAAVSRLQDIADLCAQWIEQREIPQPPSSAMRPLPSLVAEPKLLRLGQQLSAEQLGRLSQLLAWMTAWLRHLRYCYQQAGKPDCLKNVFDRLTLPVELVNTLAGWFDDNGRVADDASEELAKLNAQRRQQEAHLHNSVQNLLRQHAQHLQDRQPTERDGRVVLVFQASYKHVAGGVVHDVSASGQTAYVEPAALVNHNNRLRETDAAIDKAIEKLCAKASQLVADQLDDLHQLEGTFAFLDAQIASAKVSLQWHGQRVKPLAPSEQARPTINLQDCRHPLLSLSQGVEATVPNTVMLGGVDGQGFPQTLVITGPNTGGKSVLLKMVGLCGWLLRFGLLIPVSPHQSSSMSLLSPIGAVLGDQQDLEKNLSTFSGHVAHLADILNQPLANSLILIDEIASGTDPAEGANLAAAYLMALNANGGLTMVTTHIGRLKTLAAMDTPETNGFANASVLFDDETLSPTYKLAVGLPGASHALTIARRVGLPDAVVAKAEANPFGDSGQDASDTAGSGSTSADRLLVALGKQQQQLGKTEAALTDSEQALAEREARIDAAERALLEKKHAFTHEVQRRVRHHLQQLEGAMADTKKRLAQTTSEKDLAHRERHLGKHERHAKRLMAQAQEAISAKDHAPDIETLTVGKKVTHGLSGMTGVITSVDAKKKRLSVDCQGMMVTLPADEVVVLGEQQTGKKRRKPPKLDMLGRPVNRQQGKPKKDKNDGLPEADNGEDPLINAMPLAECKLLGMRVEEALQEVECFLDQSVLAGHRTVAVIHGVGTGRLKQAVRQHLKLSPLVERFCPAQAIHGGDGKTLVLMK
jgi:DNA mismatch repair protein MutS2